MASTIELKLKKVVNLQLFSLLIDSRKVFGLGETEISLFLQAIGDGKRSYSYLYRVSRNLAYISLYFIDLSDCGNILTFFSGLSVDRMPQWRLLFV